MGDSEGMTMVPDGQGGLPPLKVKKEPLIAVDEILAVDTVRLGLRNGTKTDVCWFYEEVLGLPREEKGEAEMAYRVGKIRVEMRLGTSPADVGGMSAGGPEGVGTSPAVVGSVSGRILFLIHQFDTALRGLSEQRIAFEYLHYDLGLCRAASLVDPSGNQVFLIETRKL
jgi:hypothetical protein